MRGRGVEEWETTCRGGRGAQKRVGEGEGQQQGPALRRVGRRGQHRGKRSERARSSGEGGRGLRQALAGISGQERAGVSSDRQKRAGAGWSGLEMEGRRGQERVFCRGGA